MSTVTALVVPTFWLALTETKMLFVPNSFTITARPGSVGPEDTTGKSGEVSCLAHSTVPDEFMPSNDTELLRLSDRTNVPLFKTAWLTKVRLLIGSRFSKSGANVPPERS